MNVTKDLIESLIIKLNGKNISKHILIIRSNILAPDKSNDIILVYPSITLELLASASEIDDIAPFSTCMFKAPIEVKNMILELEHPLFKIKFKGTATIEHKYTRNDKVASFSIDIDIEEVLNEKGE